MVNGAWPPLMLNVAEPSFSLGQEASVLLASKVSSVVASTLAVVVKVQPAASVTLRV